MLLRVGVCLLRATCNEMLHNSFALPPPPAPAHLVLQLEQLAAAQQALGSLPASLQALAAGAARQAAALQAQHGFSLAGLQAMAGETVPGEGEKAQPAPGGGVLTGSLLLRAPAAVGAGDEQAEQRLEHAALVLQGFRGKVLRVSATAGVDDGGGPGVAGSQQSVADAAAAADAVEEEAEAVAAEVQRLIAAATSAANLARMFEGWMPWV